MNFVSIALLLANAVSGSSAQAAGASIVSVHHARVRVGDIVASAPSEIAQVELGPAPLGGSTRTLTRDEVLARVQRAGFRLERASVPERTTVRLDSRQLTSDEQRHFADGAIAQALPLGATLVSVSPAHPVTIPTAASLTHVIVPALAKRAGRQVLSIVAEIALDDVVVTRVALFCTIDVSEELARPEIRRGDEVRATAGSGTIAVSTQAIAMADARTGELAQVQIVSTGRVVRARVDGRGEVHVVESP